MPHLMPKTGVIREILPAAEGIKTFVIAIEGFLALPGQFVNLWLPDIDEKPFSVAYADEKEIHLTIARLGEFTTRVFALQPGDRVGLRGPFGTAFKMTQNGNIALVGGGFGTAPLHFLGEQHKKNGNKVIMLIGARTADLLIYEKKCAASGFRVMTATEDGTKGHKGRITEVLATLLQTEKIDLVQTCGPERMMKAVAELALSHNVDCEVSVERYMKCGFGVCGQCVLNGKCMCVEGPVVAGAFALAQSEFGTMRRGSEGQKVGI